MHDVVNRCVFVLVVATSGEVRLVVSEGSIRGAVERVGVHPLCELGVVGGVRDWGVEVSMYDSCVVA